MGKVKGFFSKLKKSTIITIVSCGSFIVMTFLALLFFIKFPITPSEKIMASIGRESIYRNNNIEGLAATTTTTQTTTSQTTTGLQTTTAPATHSDFIITITTGKGFSTGVKSHEVEYDSDYDFDYSDDEEETTTATDENDDINDTTYTEPDYNDYNYNYDYGWNY